MSYRSMKYLALHWYILDLRYPCFALNVTVSPLGLLAQSLLKAQLHRITEQSTYVFQSEPRRLSIILLASSDFILWR